MGSSILLLIRDNGPAGDSASVEADAILVHWPMERRPKVRAVTIDQLPDSLETIEAGTVGWVRLDKPGPAVLYGVLDLLQERQLPTMLSIVGETDPCDPPYQDGVVPCPPETDPVAACRMLQALFSQSTIIRVMRTELALRRAHERGLCAQLGKIDEELRLAAQLQREFVPHQLPTVHDIEFHVLWRPAGYVSGDIYDVAKLDDSHVGFFIADAVGHGVPAALLTMVIKRALPTKVADPANPAGYRIIQPSEALFRLNQAFVEQQSGRFRFATACYGVIDCSQRTVCMARAGHPFPIVLRANGQTETIEPDGGLLGVFCDEQYEQASIQLDRGDRLVLYSDGCEIAFAEGSEEGRPIASARYEQEFETLRDGPLGAALAKLEQKLDNQTGSLNQLDDVTILCLGVANPPSSNPHDQADAA